MKNKAIVGKQVLGQFNFECMNPVNKKLLFAFFLTFDVSHSIIWHFAMALLGIATKVSEVMRPGVFSLAD